MMPTINWDNTPRRLILHSVLLATPRAPEPPPPLARRRADSTTGTRVSSLPVFLCAACCQHPGRAFWHWAGSHADFTVGSFGSPWERHHASSCPSARVHCAGRLLRRRACRHCRPGAAGPVAGLGGTAVVPDRLQGGPCRSEEHT